MLPWIRGAKRKSALATVLLAFAAAGCGSPAAAPRDATPSSAPRAITVVAASSLADLVTEIADAGSAASGIEVRLQFESSATLARQIREGAAADVFISAAPEWVDAVTPLDRFDWLANRLVCVTRKDAGAFDLRAMTSLAIANEQVPAGKYARAALAHLRIDMPERTVYGANVRNVLATVSQGGAQAGIVYATDAALDPNVQVAYVFPEESHPRIVYVVALLREEGRAFFQALRDENALETARRLGFVEWKRE